MVWLLFIFPARVNKKCAELDEEKKTTCVYTYVCEIFGWVDTRKDRQKERVKNTDINGLV